MGRGRRAEGFVWQAMPDEKLETLRAEVAFFDAVTGVSGRLYPVAKEERKNAAVQFVREVGPPPRNDLYLPTEPRSRLIRAIPDPLPRCRAPPRCLSWWRSRWRRKVERKAVVKRTSRDEEEEEEGEEEEMVEGDGDELENVDASAAALLLLLLSAAKKKKTTTTTTTKKPSAPPRPASSRSATTAARTSWPSRSSACCRTLSRRPASTCSSRPTASFPQATSAGSSRSSRTAGRGLRWGRPPTEGCTRSGGGSLGRPGARGEEGRGERRWWKEEDFFFFLLLFLLLLLFCSEKKKN